MQDASFAEMRARNRLGIAIAAMTKIMATTISNSISENPFGVFCLMELLARNSTIALPIWQRAPRGPFPCFTWIVSRLLNNTIHAIYPISNAHFLMIKDT